MDVILFAAAFAMAGIAFAFVAGPLRRLGSAGFSKFAVPAAGAAVLFGIGLYLAIGRPDAVVSGARVPMPVQTASSKPPGKKIASVDSLVAGLEERLRQQPDDGKGWLLLARSYDHLGRKDDSADAYARARELGVVDDASDANIAADTQVIRYPVNSSEIDKAISAAD